MHQTSNIRLAENQYRLSMKESLAEGLDKEDGPVVVRTFPDGSQYPVWITWHDNHLILEFMGGEGRLAELDGGRQVQQKGARIMPLH